MTKIVYAADAIVKYNGGIVLIERLGVNLPGIALPGGKQEPREWISETAVREVREETGLYFTIEAVLGTYAEEGRDPRFPAVSTTFVGTGTGVLRPETGKTRPFKVLREDLPNYFDRFILDHGDMIRTYLAR